MSAHANDPDSELVLPEDYVAELTESGRLARYSFETGAWVCEVDPNLANAQEMVAVVLTAHDNEAQRITKDPYS